MGSLDDAKLRDFHDQITQAIQWSSKPDYQRVCEILNGMSMPDMLDEIWRIKSAGHLNPLARFAPQATGVNVNRLLAALGAMQDDPPPGLDALIAQLPEDQQRAIKSVRATTQTPSNSSPSLWNFNYWELRTLPKYIPPPAPAGGDGKNDGKDDDDDEAHLAADIATALTANAPAGRSAMTYTVTLIYRNFDVKTFGTKDTQWAVGHEPNVSVQLSPDPNNPAAIQAVITLVNLHVKRHYGLIKPDIEVSIAGQGSVPASGGPPSGGIQAQVEVHVTTKISVTFGTSLGVGPAIKPGDPMDRGAYHFGDRNADVSFTPFMIGILGHWDPPSR